MSHLLIDHPRKGELGELFGAVHYMTTVFAAYFLGVGYNKAPVFAQGADARRVSTLFVMLMLFLLMMGWILSAGAGSNSYIATHPGFGAE